MKETDKSDSQQKTQNENNSDLNQRKSNPHNNSSNFPQIVKESENNIMEEYIKSLFINLEKEVFDAFKNSIDFNIDIKILKNKEMLILVKFKKDSPSNQILEDLFFQILVNKKFPEQMPQVTCLSNVRKQLIILKTITINTISLK